MRHPPRELLYSYVDGTTDLPHRLLVEAHLALCPTCPTRAADYQGVGEPLPDATLHDELDVPSFDRVWTAVERVMIRRRSPEAAVLPAALLTALPDPSEWQWVEFSPQRVKSALLTCDAGTGSSLFLTYFAPGSAFPRHRHIGLEENVILVGGYESGGVRADVGDWVIGAPGSKEMPRTEVDEECWCLSRIEPPGVELIGLGDCPEGG